MFASRLLAAALLLARRCAAAAFAHHGWGSYDAAKPLTVEAVIEDVEFGNPHGMLMVSHDGRKWEVDSCSALAHAGAWRDVERCRPKVRR